MMLGHWIVKSQIHLILKLICKISIMVLRDHGHPYIQYFVKNIHASCYIITVLHNFF